MEYTLDKSLNMAFALQKNELNHDFKKLKPPSLKELRELFGTIRNPRFNYHEELLKSILNDSDPDEWHATSETFKYLIRECPEELANWTIFKYEKIGTDGTNFFYLDHTGAHKEEVHSSLYPFIIGLSGDRDEDTSNSATSAASAASAASGSASGSASESSGKMDMSVLPTGVLVDNDVVYYLAIASDFMPVDVFYSKTDLLYGCVDAPIKYKLLSPLFGTHQLSNNIRIYSQEVAITNFVNMAMLWDPSVTPPVYPTDFNIKMIFDKFIDGNFDLVTDTMPIHYFAFAQLLLNPNVKFAQYFTNKTIKLFNKTFFELFGSSSEIKSSLTDAAAKDLFFKECEKIEAILPEKFDRTEGNHLNTFYELFKDVKTIYDENIHTLLLTNDANNDDNFRDVYVDDFEGTEELSIKGQYKFCRFIVHIPDIGDRVLYINLIDDLKISSINSCVNAIMSATEEGYPLIKTPGSNIRLITFAEAIYDGIRIDPRPDFITKRNMIALIVNTFKARGDGNQVALLAVLNVAINELLSDIEISRESESDKNLSGEHILLAFNKIIDKIITNDKNTVVQSVYFERPVIKASGGMQLGYTREEFDESDNHTKQIVSFYFANFLKEMTSESGGRVQPVETSSAKFEIDTKRVLFVSLPKGNPTTLIIPSILSIFDSFLSYYERQITPLREFNTKYSDIERDISKLKRTEITDEASVEGFLNAFLICIQTMTPDTPDTNDILLLFTKNFFERFKSIYDKENGKFYEGTLVDNTYKLNEFYKLLLKAKNVFDVLTGSTVAILDELESILFKDIVLLTSVLPKDVLPDNLRGQSSTSSSSGKQLTEKNLRRIQENIRKHIYGEKMNFVFDAFEKAIGKPDGSDSIFHLLPSSTRVILSLMKKQLMVKERLVSLDKCIKEVEEQRKSLRRGGRVERKNYGDVSGEEAKIAEIEDIIDGLKNQLKIAKLDLDKRVDTNTQLSSTKQKPITKMRTQISNLETKITAEILKLETLKQKIKTPVKDQFELLKNTSKEISEILELQSKSFKERTQLSVLDYDEEPEPEPEPEEDISKFVLDIPELKKLEEAAYEYIPIVTKPQGVNNNSRKVYYNKKRITRKKKPLRKTKKNINKKKPIHKKTKLFKKNKKYTHKK